MHTNRQLLELVLENVTIKGLAGFIWDLRTDKIEFSSEFFRLLGYEEGDLAQDSSLRKKLLFPEDYEIYKQKMSAYLNGETSDLEFEYKVKKKDGSTFYGFEKGDITDYSEDGKPIIYFGLMQDITALKLAEQKMTATLEKLDLAIEVAEFGIWEYDVLNNHIEYNDEYLKMFGYTREETIGTLEEWKLRNHPDDVPIIFEKLNDLLTGKTDRYFTETRMIHTDGYYLWTRDLGKIVERDEDGNPIKLVGGHLNIHELKQVQAQLENYQMHLETEIDKRTKKIMEQDKLLLTINEVSNSLLSITESENYDFTVTESLEKLALVFNVCEIGLWRVVDIDNKRYTYQEHSYRDGEKIAYDTRGMKEHISSADNGESLVHQRKDGNVFICCHQFNEDYFSKTLQKGKAVRNFYENVPPQLQETFYNSSKNYRSLLVAPVFVVDDLFGYIAISGDKEGVEYTEVQESMLLMAGNLFANARRRYEMDLQVHQAHEEALLSSKAKSNFLANMSHEIRTPLNAILGMAEIVVRDSEGGATAEYATEIKKASRNLLSIINDILDISKIESGKLEIIELEYYITSLLNDVIGLSKVRLQNKSSVILTTHIDNKIPAKLIGDEIRVKQILLNILSNAIKFTRVGNIHFSATSEHSDGKTMLTFVVKDTGIGIKKEDMEKLFMQFERVDTKKNRNIEGTGLGLAITKQLCEMMGGSISVESEVGKGSTFTIKLPQKYNEYIAIVESCPKKEVLIYEARDIYAQAVKSSIEDIGSVCEICNNQSDLLNLLNERDFDFLFVPAVHVSKVKNLKQSLRRNFIIVLMVDPGDTVIYRDSTTVSLPISCIQLANIFGSNDKYIQEKEEIRHFVAPKANILVVDDNQVNLKVAKGLMTPYNFKIDTAVNGALAVEMIKNNIYDLVFMDHMMPEMDGIDATNVIRGLDGDYYKNVPIIALTANALVGARELFVKEGMNDFLAKPIEIQKLNSILLNWIPKGKIKFVSSATDESDDENILTIDGVNTEHGIKLIGGNMDDYIDILHSFYNDGVNKINTIGSAFAKQDFKNFRIDVHAVKSAAATIGAYGISEQAKKLEMAAIDNNIQYITAYTDEFIDNYTQLLYDIKDSVSFGDEENAEKAQGDVGILKDRMVKLEEALTELDIDSIEIILEECLAYDWSGEINSLLNNIKEFVEAFDYYSAEEPLKEINDQILKFY